MNIRQSRLKCQKHSDQNIDGCPHFSEFLFMQDLMAEQPQFEAFGIQIVSDEPASQ